MSKRSRLARQRHNRREEDYHARKLLKQNERAKVWDKAFYDRILDEVVNRLHCEWVPIEKGEVLIDSRIRGTFQLIGGEI